MWQERQSELLREEIEVLLASLSDMANLYDLVKEPLAKARRGLAYEGEYGPPWHLLPLMVCEAISGHYEHALPAAAALQLFVAAADVLDDIEDMDSSESLSARYSSALAFNVATILLILAESAIVRLKARGVEDHIIVQVMDTINSFCITACAGQHLDLSCTSKIAVTEDTYLNIIGMKSASQLECFCHIGALLATTNQELINTFALFGHNLGMAAQITNDIHGITQGSDVVKYKITLPIIYALTHTDSEVRNQLEITFGQQTETVIDSAQIRDLLFRIGAIHYATIKMEFYKQRALDILSEAERAGAKVERIKLFLE